jgi:cupin 2 domain-containing protein
MTETPRGSLLSNLSFPEDLEIVTTLVEADACRIERIVSSGQATPPGEWLEQDRREFVVVLTGRARLAFEGEAAALSLGAGDWVDIPAHRRHRVDWTDPDQPTVWLAVHISKQPARPE